MAGAVGYAFWTDATALNQQASLQAQEHAAQYAQPAYIAIECEAADVAALGQDQCISAEAEAAREAQRSEYDLEAQQTMAIWTRVMGKAAIIGMGVGILGLFLIFVTFWETRKGVEATREANAIALNQMRSQLVCDGGEFRVEGNSAFFHFIIRNTGKITAENCQARLELTIPAKIDKDGNPTEGGLIQWIRGKPGFSRAVRSGHSETIDLKFTSIESPHPPTGTTIIHQYYMDKLRDEYYRSATLYLSWGDELGPKRSAHFYMAVKAGSESADPNGTRRGVYLSKAR